MDDQQRARELLAQQFEAEGFVLTAAETRAGKADVGTYVRAITAALRAAPEVTPAPDATLLRFYGVSTYPELVSALDEHVLKLIDLRKRNVKPWEDTMPPTLLPRHEREQSPVFAKDLLALADRWQDDAAETWGEGPVNSTKQACCDELREIVAHAIAARPQGVKDRPPIDGCTESNCKRCRTHPNHRGDMEHAGIGWRPDSPQEARDA